VAALVCGIAAFVICPVLPAVAAVILASSAKRKIRDSGGRLDGEGMATAGQVLGWINIGLAALGVLAIVLIATLSSGGSSGY
jgi:predicted metal-binding membrane protein